MKLLSKTIFGLLLTTVAVSAAPICVDGAHLDAYIALAGGGCTLGNLLFANFGYSYALAGGAGTGLPQPASVVQVSLNPVNEQIQFGGNWVVDHSQTSSLSITFTVSAPATHPISTLTNTNTAFASGTFAGGPISSIAAVCSGGTCGPTGFTDASVNISATQGPLSISNTLTANANGTRTSLNVYHLSVVTDQFAETAPPVANPEPVTCLITGTAIGALAFLRRRKKA